MEPSPIPAEPAEKFPWQDAPSGYRWRIIGSGIEALEIEIGRKGILSNNGAMRWRDGTVNYDMKSIGSLWDGLMRSLTGAGVLLPRYTSAGRGHVVFSGASPCMVVPVDLNRHPEGFCWEAASFLAGEDTQDITPVAELNSFGLFGRDGMIFQKIAGSGMVFGHAMGVVRRMELAKGQSVLVEPGAAVGWDARLRPQKVHLKLSTTLFSSKTWLNFRFTGPGLVVLQTDLRNGAGSSLFKK